MNFARVALGEPNAVTVAERQARAAGKALLNMSDANPTHWGLAPEILPGIYRADPRGPLADRQLLADFLSEQRAHSHSHRMARSVISGGDRHAADAGNSAAGNSEAGCSADGHSTVGRSTDSRSTAGRLVTPEQLYLLSSTSQAYSWLMKLLCAPGDAVLAPAPGYPLVEQLARLEGVAVQYYQLGLHEQWAIDTAGIAQALAAGGGEKIRALVLINPNNPTGSYVQPEELEKLIELCQRYELAIIADEVFFEYQLRAGAVSRLAGESRVLTFALDGLSKQLGAPGAKVAWIEVSGPAAMVASAQQRLDVIADAYLPWSQLQSAHLAELLAAVPGQRERVQTRCQQNLATLHELVAADPSGVTSVLTPAGGWSALVRFPAHIDENALILALIAAGVTAQPGYFFDMPQLGFVNLSLLLAPKAFCTAVQTLLAAIDRLS